MSEPSLAAKGTSRVAMVWGIATIIIDKFSAFEEELSTGVTQIKTAVDKLFS